MDRSQFGALDAVGNASTTSLAADAGVLFNGNASAVHSKIHTGDSGQIQFFADPTAALGAFSFPTGLENGSRDTLRGPHFANVDLGIAKTFRCGVTNTACNFVPTPSTPSITRSSGCRTPQSRIRRSGSSIPWPDRNPPGLCNSRCASIFEPSPG